MSAMDTAETTSERGGTKLFVDGFAYNHKRNGVAHKRWVCVRKHGSICNAAISTLLDNSGPFDATPHNHPADPTAFGVCEAKAQMKTVAKATRTAGRTRAIMADILMNTDDNTRANIGNLNSLLRSVRRHVQGNAPADPAHRRDLEIEEAWKTTGGDNPRPFMIYDNGIGRDNRVVIYGSRDGLLHLCRSEVWYMDGNFSIVPAIFSQLYVIRAPLGNTTVACVYAFLPTKSTGVYRELFQAISDGSDAVLGFLPDPRRCVLDFEMATMTALTGG